MFKKLESRNQNTAMVAIVAPKDQGIVVRDTSSYLPQAHTTAVSGVGRSHSPQGMLVQKSSQTATLKVGA